MQFSGVFIREKVTQSGCLAYNSLTNVMLLWNKKMEPDFLNLGGEKKNTLVISSSFIADERHHPRLYPTPNCLQPRFNVARWDCTRGPCS
jgi:hypothetical protein